MNRKRERPTDALTCHIPGCENTTRERKPFCAEHVEEHPYISDLMDRLADSEGKVVQNLVLIYKSIGGGWQPEPAAPDGEAP